jgi:N-ethylmaleimide reductase
MARTPNLVQQFLSSNANLRRDGWGTTIEGRVRYPLELVNAVASRIGAERLALRISPGCTHHGIEEDDLDAVYLALVEALPPRLAFLGVFEFPGHRALTRRIRERWTGVIVRNPHETEDEWPAGPQQLDVIDRGLADMVAFGTHFISNPALVHRLRVGAPLTPADEATFYMGDHHGYTD